VRGRGARRVPPGVQELRQVHRRRQRRLPLRRPHHQLLQAPLHAGRVRVIGWTPGSCSAVT